MDSPIKALQWVFEQLVFLVSAVLLLAACVSTSFPVTSGGSDVCTFLEFNGDAGSTQKPEDMYRIIEHFALGRRRLELFGEDHNIRTGWLTVGKELSSSNFNAETYIKNFADKDGKVWQGGGGRNPPPDAPHLVVTTPEIEALRPKSPMKNQQQMQQNQSVSISLTPSSSNRRPPANPPENPTALGMNQEASGSNIPAPLPWPSPMEGFKGPESGNLPMEDKVFDVYNYTGQPNAEYLDFESQRAMNML